MSKVFSKELWLKSANAQKEKGILTQGEINDALKIWVNDLDGKTVEEIVAAGNDITSYEKWII